MAAVDIEETTERLPGPSFAAIYSLAHVGKSLFWHASELLFGYFLTEICALPPRLTGLILGGSLLLSAYVDLCVGRYLARSVTGIASAGRVQWLGAMTSCLTFALFGFSNLVRMEVRFVFALISIVAFRIAYAFLDNPQNAMLALASHDDKSRTHLSSLRYICGGVANLVIVIIFATTLRRELHDMYPADFALAAVAIAAIGAVSSYLLWQHLRRHAINTEIDHVEAPPEALVATPRIRQWPILLGMFLISIASSLIGRLQPYAATYQLTGAFQGSAWMACIAIGMTVSQPCWRYAANRHSLVWALRAATVVFFAGSLSFDVIARQGIVGSALSGLLYGCGCGGMLMSLWALAAASVRNDKASTSATATFGMLTFSSKLALACAALGVGEFLARLHYQSPDGHGIVVFMSWVPAASAAACFVLSYFLCEKTS
ncbi:MFS transporter [Dyella acidisoli]|uniref:MFS sugar transporter n=1 Tax=Dyella acidisoli TaxID=1867834 RepID=A0ABQ5XJ39_9GAMM|nr:MFS transporter [Dyella acidisoli]GLQ91721.1 MFS sugar transporter [Dyella acidisoli]